MSTTFQCWVGIANISSCIVSIIAIIIMVFIYRKTTNTTRKEFIIRGNEKVIHAFMSRFFTHVNDSIPEVYHRKKTYELNKESIWSSLDAFYAGSAEDYVKTRSKMSEYLKEWTHVGSLDNFRKIDENIRKYYGLWPPSQILIPTNPEPQYPRTPA